MTKEDIIKLAREAASEDGTTRPDKNIVLYAAKTSKFLERFAQLVRAYEREACAAVCCDMIDAEYKTGKVDHNEMAWTQACANAIRARGEP